MEMQADGQKIYSVKADIPAGVSTVSYYIEATDEKGIITAFPDGGAKNPVSVMVTNDTTGPVASIDRIEVNPVGKPVHISARVSDQSGVKWVRLRYRHLTQYEDYETLEMKADQGKDVYTGEIPGSFVIPTWDIMYFIETMDKAGNGCQYPCFETEDPYVIVKLER